VLSKVCGSPRRESLKPPGLRLHLDPAMVKAQPYPLRRCLLRLGKSAIYLAYRRAGRQQSVAKRYTYAVFHMCSEFIQPTQNTGQFYVGLLEHLKIARKVARMEISGVNLSQGPIAPPAPAGESAGAARPLPKERALFPTLAFRRPADFSDVSRGQ
jgi:hypothetical protein